MFTAGELRRRQPGRRYFGGCSSLFNQPVTVSDLSGSGRSHSGH